MGSSEISPKPFNPKFHLSSERAIRSSFAMRSRENHGFSPGGMRLMFSNSRLTCLLLVALFCTAAASAQQANPQAHPASGKIFLDVVVSPKSGPPVADLQQQDFTLLDNNSPQPITSFQPVTGRQAPVEVVLVIDAINSDARTVSYERIQIDKFLLAEGGRLAFPVAIAVATDTGVKLAENFSSDGNVLRAALAGLSSLAPMCNSTASSKERSSRKL